MSDLTTPTRTRQRRRRVRSRTLRRAVRGLRDQLRYARLGVALALVAAAAGWGLTVLPDAEPAQPETAVVAEAVPLGKGRAGVKTAAPESAPDTPEADEPGEVVGAGEASYYGQELAGNPTASGERFDPEGLTAAHRTLPLGSRLRVTNPSNGESVIVRVNDRGPFAPHRVVDVSERAARELGMLRSGTARVKLELLPKKRG